MSIDLASVRDRVASEFQFAGDAVDAADAMANMSAPVPAVYVSTARETAAPNRNATGRHTQMVTSTVSILFALGAQRADAALSDEVEAKKKFIIEQLIGWTAAGAGTPFDYVSFAVRFMGEGLLFCELLFAARYLETKLAT